MAHILSVFFLLNYALWIHLQLVAAVNGKYSFSLLLYIPHCGHAYHLTSAIIMIFKMCLTVPVTQPFIIYYSTLKSGRRESNPHGYQTLSAARGLQHLQIWLGDMPFFQLNYVL